MKYKLYDRIWISGIDRTNYSVIATRDNDPMNLFELHEVKGLEYAIMKIDDNGRLILDIPMFVFEEDIVLAES